MNTGLVNQFPKFYRFITEHRLYIAACLVSGALLFGILFQGIALISNIREQKLLGAKREALTNEIQILTHLTITYPSSRDLYLQLGVLEYRLGNITQAKLYVNRALAIDPNFQQAGELADKLR